MRNGIEVHLFNTEGHMIKNYTLEGSQTPVKLESVQQTGFGVTGHVVWNIISPRRLTSDEILEIVEGEYHPKVMARR